MANWFTNFWGGKQKETRNAPSYSLSDPDLLRILGVSDLSVSAGPSAAMGLSTFFGSVTLIADLIASQPMALYKETDRKRTKARKHSLYRLLAVRPNRHMTAFTFKRTLILNTLVHGNGIATITRDIYNRPIELIAHDTRNVQLLEDTHSGLIFYGVTENGTHTWYSDEDVIHLKDYTFSGKIGRSVVSWQAETLKINLLSKEFIGRYYAKGAFMTGFLSTSLNINDSEKAKAYKKNIVEALNGGDAGGFGFAVLGSDAKWTSVTRSPVESQVVELLKQSDVEWAQVFKVPPILIGNTEKQTSFGSGVEQMFIQLTNTVLIPRATDMEQEFDYKCLRSDEQDSYYTSINFQNLLRGDNATRGQFYKTMVETGLMMHDEVRGFEELGPLPNGTGSRTWIQQNMMPMDKADEIMSNKYERPGKENPTTSNE